MKKRDSSFKGNLLLFVISAMASITIVLLLYPHLIKNERSSIYRGANNDYSLSFYNQKGQILSKMDGPLKLILDPFSVYRNYPNQISKSYTINSNGFRDGFINANATHEAFVLGGSAAFGHGLKDNINTFASQLSLISDKYNVVNSATVGFLSGQELSQMVHYLDNFNPSLYVVFNGWNDIAIPFLAIDWQWPANYVGFNNMFFKIGERLAQFHEQTSKEIPPEPIKENAQPLKETELTEKISETYIHNIHKMNAFAGVRQAKFLLVFQPELSNKKYITPEEQSILQKWNDSAHGRLYQNKNIQKKYNLLKNKMKKIAANNNIALLDIDEQPEFSKNKETLFFDIVHPNKLGHRVIAKIIDRKLSNF